MLEKEEGGLKERERGGFPWYKPIVREKRPEGVD